MHRALQSEGAEYASNIAPPTFPDGQDIEVFSKKLLKDVALNATKSMTANMLPPIFARAQHSGKPTSRIRLISPSVAGTVDEPADLEVISNIFEHFAPRIDFEWTDVLALEETHPELFHGNKTIARNEGRRGSGQRLWKRAKKLIPGGNMLLSKRAEMFLPERWPAYFSKSKGCTVWDLDGAKYTDMSIMGIGTNILGYGHPEVDEAVKETVTNGNMSTLNCPEEVSRRESH